MVLGLEGTLYNSVSLRAYIAPITSHIYWQLLFISFFVFNKYFTVPPTHSRSSIKKFNICSCLKQSISFRKIVIQNNNRFAILKGLWQRSIFNILDNILLQVSRIFLNKHILTKYMHCDVEESYQCLICSLFYLLTHTFV